MKTKLETYLKNTFPKSDLQVSFLEVVTEYQIGISLDLREGKYSTPETLYNAFQKSVDVFNSIFDSAETPIFALVNQWDTSPSEYLESCFTNPEKDSETWLSFDAKDVRKQTLYVKKRDEINYYKLFQAIINVDCQVEPMLNSRIYFIEPKKHITFLFWDSCLYVGSNDANQIAI